MDETATPQTIGSIKISVVIQSPSAACGETHKIVIGTQSALTTSSKAWQADDHGKSGLERVAA